LARHFVALATKKHGRPPVKIRPNEIKKLQRYEWTGNVRELQHVIERAVIMSHGNVLDLTDILPASNSRPREEGPTPARGSILSFSELKRLERDSIVAALKESEGKIYGADGAADLLGVKPTTLSSRIKALGISRTAKTTR
jgi:DNA-binding NtrC family response regulator